MKIYTKTGDNGETGLYDGTRVSKTEQIFDLLGTIDELSAHIGMLMFYIRNIYNCEIESKKSFNDLLVKHDLVGVITFLENLQQKLLNIGSIIATPNPKPEQKLPNIDESDVKKIEDAIDNLEVVFKLEPLTTFLIQSGTTKGEAQAHICRTIARRSEREILKYGNVDENICKFMNRLSDYFFTLARVL